MEYRKLTKQEQNLLKKLVELSSLNLPSGWIERLLVSPLNDGGMGSLRLFPNEKSDNIPKFGRAVSEYHFLDTDGVKVIATLNLDDKDELYELDIWKTDFTELKHLPDM